MGGLFLLLLLVPFEQSVPQGAANGIQHVVVMVQENHTFDNYFATFPGINGISNYPPSLSPFHITGAIVDQCHTYQCAREAYNNGRMDRFLQVAGSTQTFGYYDGSDIPYYWSLAKNYTLLDNYYSSFMGQSFPNYLYLVAAQNAGITTNLPQPYTLLQINSIVDLLEARHVSWAYYSGGFLGNDSPLPLFSSIARNASRTQNLKDSSNFLNDLSGGSLRQVTWLLPPAGQSEHPPEDIRQGEAWVKQVITRIRESQFWSSTVIFLTWDDYGGWYDHVAPPQTDEFGFGFRVPMIIVSPFAKHGFIDHALADHTSILAFIESTFRLGFLSQRDAGAYNFMNSLAVDHPPDAQSLTIEGSPNVSRHGEIVFVNTIYRNIADGSQQGSLYLVIKNEMKQPVAIESTPISTIQTQSIVATATPFLLSPGNYSVDLFIISARGTPMSRSFTLRFTAP